MTSCIVRPCAVHLKSIKSLKRTIAPVRRLCANAGQTNSVCEVSLSKPLPGFSTPKYSTPSNLTTQTEITTLENGLKVATEGKYGQFSTLGVVIDSGSRYEVNFPSGISHFLEKLSFQGTSRYRNRDHIQQQLEDYGGICDCQGSRDVLIYAASVETRGADMALDVVSEAILRPTIQDQELQAAQAAILSEIEMLHMNPDPQYFLTELIHEAAYRENTLGLPKFCLPNDVENIDQSTIYTYLNTCHTPDRMVLAGVGVEHSTLVELAKKHFVAKKPIWEEKSDIVNKSKVLDTSISQYTGGDIRFEKDMSNVSLGPTPMPEFCHFVLGFESCSHQDDDFIAFCVLNMMMGGGGSFSAGGPGKGMYTRLYLNVLNRCHWMNSATAFNHAYQDSGLFCIAASAPPSQCKSMVEVIIREFLRMSDDILPVELDRAKTQLQSMLLMNLESRPIIFEDIGRQVLANGTRKTAKELYDSIGAITSEDIQRVANRMLRSKPSVAGLGDLSRLPSYDNINEALINQGHFPKKFSLFS